MALSLHHVCLPVTDLSASLAFYKKALGLQATGRSRTNGRETVVLSDGKSGFGLRLLHDPAHPKAYALGENEFHVGFMTEDIGRASRLHKEMGCVCYENPRMGIYFIEDPDGHWLEVLPVKRSGQAESTHAGFVQNHVNINVADADRSLAFYRKATGWSVARESSSEAYRIIFLADSQGESFLELTWLKDHPQPYDLGENPRRVVLASADLPAARRLHERAGLVSGGGDEAPYEFADPDGYLVRVTNAAGS